MISNCPNTSHNRRWVAGVGFVGGAAVAAAMIGTAGASTARADTPDDVVGQAITDLNQGTAVVDAASTADLSTRQADALAEQTTLASQTDPILLQLESLQDSMPAADQSALGGVDGQLITAAQNVVSADQAFVAADQAGELSSNSFLPIDLTTFDADLGMGGALLSADWDSFVTLLDGLGTVGAGSASAVGAADPTALLSEATTNYTAGNEILAGLPSGGDYAPNVATITQFDDQLLQAIGNVGSAESALDSYDNGALSELLNPVFTNVDQSWDSVSQAALNADQALDSAVATGSTTDQTEAVLGLIGPEYQALEPALQSDLIDLGAHFLTGGDFTSLGDLASGVDPSAAIDPGMFADLSSIGF
jgi:hypothetical protein